MIEEIRSDMEMEGTLDGAALSILSTPRSAVSCSFSCSGGCCTLARNRLKEWSMLAHVTMGASHTMVVQKKEKESPHTKQDHRQTERRRGEERVVGGP